MQKEQDARDAEFSDKSLLHNIYLDSIEQGHFSSALKTISERLGYTSSNLEIRDIREPITFGTLHESAFGISDTQSAVSNEIYVGSDCCLPVLESLPIGGILDERASIRSQFLKVPSNREWVDYLAIDYTSTIGSLLLRSGSLIVKCSFSKSKKDRSLLTDKDRERLLSVLTHIGIAARSYLRVYGRDLQLVAEPGGHISIPGICLVNRANRVLAINQAAQRLFFENPDFSYRVPNLIFHSDSAARDFALARMQVFGGKSSAFSFVVRNTLSHSSTSIVCSSLPNINSHDSSSPCELMLVTFSSEAKEDNAQPRVTQMKYGFTKAEAKVAQMLCEGLPPKSIASRNDVSVGTVRAQIQSLLRQTQTQRQSELLITLFK